MSTIHLRQRIPSIAPVLLLLFLGLTGCESGDGRFSIQGNVQFDGTPVEEGKILFLPSDETLSQAVSEISSGSYSIGESSGVFEGNYKVQIYAYRGTGEIIDLGPLYGNEKREKREQFLPEKFNLNSELTVSISQEKHNYDFDLKE